MTDESLSDLFDKAFALHQAGLVEAAEALYQQVAARDPNHGHAVHSLGVIAHSRAQRQAAILLLRRAVTLNPEEAVFRHSLAQALRAQGQLNESVRLLKDAVSINPEFVGAWQALAEIYNVLALPQEAAEASGKVTRLSASAAEVHNSRGLALARERRLKAACAEFRAGISCNPNGAGLYHNLGFALAQLGQLADAVLSLRQAAALAPKSAETYVVLSNILLLQGDVAGARKACQQAYAIDPGIPKSRFHLTPDAQDRKSAHYAVQGIAASATFNSGAFSGKTPKAQMLALAIEKHRAGHLAAAESLYDQVLTVDPNNVQALNLLGLLRLQCDQTNGCIELIRKSLMVDTDQSGLGRTLGELCDSPALLLKLGTVFSELRRDADALAASGKAVALGPTLPHACSIHGLMLQNNGHFAEAVPYYERAIENGHNTNKIAAYWHGLGSALGHEGRLTDALRAYEIVLSHEPDNVTAHLDKAILLLKSGDFEAGWAEFEWRHRLLDQQSPPLPSVPWWRGEPLLGKRIAVLSEQGFGDTIQFARYVPLLAARGAQVLLVCQRELTRLMTQIDGVYAVHGTDAPPANLDFKIRVMSLPLRFQTTLDTIPKESRYIKTNVAATKEWSRRLGAKIGLRVGLVWAGRRVAAFGDDRTDRRRSFPLATYGPLLGIPGARFYSLQKDVPAYQGKGPIGSATSPLVDFPSDVDDFHDLAPLIENLDLVISVDTSVAHLAAALGKPVWLMSRYDGCWRWFVDRPDSPWYPTMRIFRQPHPQDWSSLILRIKEELAQFAATNEQVLPSP